MALTKNHYLLGGAVVLLLLVLPFMSKFQQPIATPEPLSARQSIRNFDKLEEQYKRRLLDTVTTEKLNEIVKANANYKSKAPFPHTLFDSLFPLDVLEAVGQEIPDNPHLNSKGCVETGQKCYNSQLQKAKNAFDEEKYFGPATLSVFQTLKSPQFTQFLEKLTGISDLIPDPEYRGSGVHQTLSGGYLNIHADFNRYEVLLCLLL